MSSIPKSLLLATIAAAASVSNAQSNPRETIEKSVACMRLNFIAANVLLDIAKDKGDTGVESKWMPRAFIFNQRGEAEKREISQKYVATKKITDEDLERLKAKYNEKIVIELTKKLEAIGTLTPEAVAKVFEEARPTYGCRRT